MYKKKYLRKIIKLEEVVPDQYQITGGLVVKHKRNLKTGLKLVTAECGHQEIRRIGRRHKDTIVCNFCAEADGVIL